MMKRKKKKHVKGKGLELISPNDFKMILRMKFTKSLLYLL